MTIVMKPMKTSVIYLVTWNLTWIPMTTILVTWALTCSTTSATTTSWAAMKANPEVRKLRVVMMSPGPILPTVKTSKVDRISSDMVKKNPMKEWIFCNNPWPWDTWCQRRRLDRCQDGFGLHVRIWNTRHPFS